ncbi:hypothetical protein, partial [Streptomyces specialis]|uniref:hypothetical protein n=1 Tax=Streptomyces specialis TaxID=498367 RepID=UPI00073ECD1E
MEDNRNGEASPSAPASAEETAATAAFPGFPALPPEDALPALVPLDPDESPWAAGPALFDERPARKPVESVDEAEPRPSRSRLLYVGLLCGVLLGVVMARADEIPMPLNDSASSAETRALAESLSGIGIS